MLRIGIAKHLAFVVSKQQVIAIARDLRARQDRNLSAAAGHVDGKGRHGIASRVAAQSFDDFERFGDWRAEVRRPDDQIRLIEVVGLDATAEQPVEQPLADVDAVVDSGEQRRLAAQRDPGMGQPGAGLATSASIRRDE